jgi:uncharacterized protein YdeI (YjbR/CyaY-like superfamily)
MEIGEILRVHSIDEVAAWLDVHGTSAREIWVLLYKKASGKQTVTYDELVDTALCYGWIDGLRKSLDAESYVQRLAPRRPKSHWTTANIAKARRLIADGRMRASGRAALPPELPGDVRQ